MTASLPVGKFRPKSQRRSMKLKERLITRAFTKLYYDCWRKGHKTGTSPATLSLHWFGHEMLKCPMDLWVYQEIISERRPDWIVECGTYRGGSALYMASLLDLLGHGRIATIDPNDYERRPEHPRIHYVKGSSTDTAIVDQIRTMVDGQRCLVILDSDHARDHVRQELDLYCEMVHVGDYLIVEDSCVNSHPVYRRHGPGPMEALRDFLTHDSRFIVDRERERFLLTMNPSGYLKRIG
ncbi:MAG: class I SAM-dependent methyltransferase [Pirellulaceae bacterium]|jgi:cephalosporin hydroxylase|nr:class I SAM-dependent methyltransferase [Pirellulaceae bacterium]